jgi:hypothetical protein
VTGPVFLLAAAYATLTAFGVLPMRVNPVLLIPLGVAIFAFAIEVPLGSYRKKP